MLGGVVVGLYGMCSSSSALSFHNNRKNPPVNTMSNMNRRRPKKNQSNIQHEEMVTGGKRGGENGWMEPQRKNANERKTIMGTYGQNIITNNR